MFRFIHCADLHLDSPFKGIASATPVLAETLYHAQFAAFNSIIDLAIEEQVDALIIAGDAFDAAEQSLFARLRFEEQLRRLDTAGIRSFYACGNHDPLRATDKLRVPPGCHIFGREVEKVTVIRNGLPLADIYGISYPVADVRDNLARRFPQRETALPSVAILHCNVGNIADHLPYAPATVDDLRQAGMDYWALGHVHRRIVIREDHPTIVYPGCMQGSDIRETGAHGCALVTIADNGDVRLNWHELDLVRYSQHEIDITGCPQLNDVTDAVTENARRFASLMDGRHAILRLALTGRPTCGDKLRNSYQLDDVLKEARKQLEEDIPVIWVESLSSATTPLYDLDQLRQGHDFRAELVRQIDAMAATPEQLPAALHQDWQQIFRDSRAAGDLTTPDAAATASILNEARFRLLDLLKTGDE